jgi:hydrogenase/urease accessory protein HupE
MLDVLHAGFRCSPQLLRALTIAFGLAVSTQSRAHDPGLSVATASRVGGTLTIHLAMARSDAERLVPLDANHDGKISETEFQAALPQLEAIARQAFRVTASGRTLVPPRPHVTMDEREGVQFHIEFPGLAAGALSECSANTGYGSSRRKEALITSGVGPSAIDQSLVTGVLPEGVAQTSKSAVSQVSKPAPGEGRAIRRAADMDVGDTAGLETCATLEQHAVISSATSSKHTLTIQAALLDKLPRGHRQFISLRDHDQHPLGEQMLDASHATFTAQLPEHPLPAPPMHSFREFLGLGVEHIATGYDHLLFLLGLLLVGGSLRAALKIITSFTLAHSITLALATLHLINLPPRLIEPLIAASIVFVGVQNLLGRGLEKRWLLTFGFGLIHGCGFASALRDLGIGTDGGSIAVPLISFNLGVELGQLAIAALVLPCIWKCRTSPMFVRRFVPVGSAMIVLAGGFWLIERTVL